LSINILLFYEFQISVKINDISHNGSPQIPIKIYRQVKFYQQGGSDVRIVQDRRSARILATKIKNDSREVKGK